MEMMNRILLAVQTGDLTALSTEVETALGRGDSPEMILNDGLIAGMKIVGEKFKAGEYFIPNVLISARAMNSAIQRLEPLLIEAGVKSTGKMLIGTVRGDLHDIGKTLVKIMFKGSGFDIVDLGTNVAAETFVEKARDEKPDIIALSALLTTTMLGMGEIIQALRGAGITAPVIIGGAPTSPEFAVSIGADLWAHTASEGVDLVLDRLERSHAET